MISTFMPFLKTVGLPVAILLIVLFRADHYVDRLLNIFNNLSTSVDDLTAEIKTLKYFIHMKDPNENSRPRRPE